MTVKQAGARQGGVGGGNEATDTQLPYDPRDTGHRSQLEPVLNGGGGGALHKGAIWLISGWSPRKLRGRHPSAPHPLRAVSMGFKALQL